MELDPVKHESDRDLNWGELEDLLAGFAKLARSDVPFSRVGRELLDHLVGSLAAVGAALWMADEQGVLSLERQINLEVLGSDALTGGHRQWLQDLVRSGHPTVIRPNEQGSFSKEHTLIIVPLMIDTDAAGLVELIQRPSLSNDAIEGNVRFASLLAELVADFLRRQEIRELRLVSQRSRQFEQFIRQLHGTLDSRVVVADLANEGRRYIGCDRASVAVRIGGRFRLAAVSAVDVINRRSILVKRLEKLVRLLAPLGEQFWHDGEKQELPPQIETALSKYLDESHASILGIIPLSAKRRNGEPAVIGAMVVEGFGQQGWDHTHEMSTAVASHGSLALSNALRYRSLPTIPYLRNRYRMHGEPTHRAAKLVIALALIGAITSTFYFDTDFNVYAEGELQPSVRHHVFAPLDGEIARVEAFHGDKVQAGDPLIAMTNSDLDLDIQRIQGEHDATLQRSSAIESAILDYNASTDNSLNNINQLASEQAELAQLFASQKQRLALLREQREKLTVRSPIAGQILTWETEQELLNRPVRSGQRLMTVADLDGPWEALLRVPDDRVGPLLELQKAGVHEIEATFELATDIGLEYRGKITKIAQRAEIDATNQPFVRVTVAVEAGTLTNPRPGATLNARIFCGRRSIFYVWCHDLIEQLQGWLKF